MNDFDEIPLWLRMEILELLDVAKEGCKVVNSAVQDTILDDIEDILHDNDLDGDDCSYIHLYTRCDRFLNALIHGSLEERLACLGGLED